MKTKVCLTMILCFLFICLNTSAHAEDVPPLAVSISGPAIVQSGEDIEIGITLTNISNAPVIVGSQISPREAERSFTIDVRGLYGNVVQRTIYGLALEGKANPATKEAMSMIMSGHISGVLEPNDKFQQSSTVSKLYDMTVPGQYVIQVEQHLYKGPTIKSNQIIIEVVKAIGKNGDFAVTATQATGEVVPDSHK